MILQKGEKCFKTIKIEIKKKNENWDFSKGVSPWFWQKKNETFPSFNFWQKTNKQTNSPQNVFEKIEKLGFFQRGFLVCGFDQKFEIFPCFYFW